MLLCCKTEKRYTHCQRQRLAALIKADESNLESEVKMSKVKILKVISFVLVGLGHLILQSQMKNLLQIPIAEFGLAIPGIAQSSPIIDLVEMLQDALVDGVVNGSIRLVGLIASLWITFRK